MTKVTYLISGISSVIFLVMLLSGCDTGGDKKRVGYIDLKVVLAKSELARQERIYLEHIENLIKDTDNKAKKLYATIDASTVNVHRVSDQRMLYELLKTARLSARNLVIQKIIMAAEKISENNGLQFKHYGSLVLISEEYVDLTEQVIEELKDSTVIFGPLPRLYIQFPSNIEESQPLAVGVISIM